MIKCNETFSDIVEVWPFAEGKIAYTVPFNVRSRTLKLADFGVESLEQLLLDKSFYTIGDVGEDSLGVEMEERQTNLKSTTKFSSGGRSFDISLTLIINEKSIKSANMMDELESTRHDFLLKCADGDYLFVRSAEMSYRCIVEEEIADSYQQKLSISFENYNGIQRFIV